MPRTELELLEKLFDAKLEPLQNDIKELKDLAGEGRKANARIDRYESKAAGILIGSTATGGLGGFSLHMIMKKFGLL